MHGATAEGLRIDHFTESGFDEGWAGEEDGACGEGREMSEGRKRRKKEKHLDSRQ
jgi:hypothetical protein